MVPKTRRTLAHKVPNGNPILPKRLARLGNVARLTKVRAVAARFVDLIGRRRFVGWGKSCV